MLDQTTVAIVTQVVGADGRRMFVQATARPWANGWMSSKLTQTGMT
jgi:hypothetical protein